MSYNVNDSSKKNTFVIFNLFYIICRELYIFTRIFLILVFDFPLCPWFFLTIHLWLCFGCLSVVFGSLDTKYSVNSKPFFRTQTLLFFSVNYICSSGIWIPSILWPLQQLNYIVIWVIVKKFWEWIIIKTFPFDKYTKFF